VVAVLRYPFPVANSDLHSMTLFVSALFANAYDVFLMREYFISVPKALGGTNSLRTTVLIFHFCFVWNQYFEPLVYLLGTVFAGVDK
jgi:ABC-type glycerol-3-phosphate transport system permease component